MPTIQLTGDPLREIVAQLRQASQLVQDETIRNQELFEYIIDQINSQLTVQAPSSQLNLFRIILQGLSERTEQFVRAADQLAAHLELAATQFDSVDQALRTGDLIGDPDNPGAVLAEFQETAVEVYIDTDSRDEANDVFTAIDSLANAMGIYSIAPAEVHRGSFSRRSKVVIASIFEDKSVQQRLQSLERLLELWQIDPRQADVDQKTSDALSRVIGSLEGIPRACIRFGSLLIVKYQDSSGSVLLTRQLSQPEIWAFEKYPELQSQPENIFQALALATAGQLESTAGASGEA